MNRAYLSPPWALYQTFAACLAPLVFWAVIALRRHSLPELERIYFTDYLRVGSLPGLSSLRIGPGAVAPCSGPQVLICY